MQLCMIYTIICRDITVRKFRADHAIFNLDSESTVETQIDESIFGKKCKYNKGKPYKRRRFFGLPQPSSHQCYLEIVAKKR